MLYNYIFSTKVTFFHASETSEKVCKSNCKTSYSLRISLYQPDVFSDRISMKPF